MGDEDDFFPTQDSSTMLFNDPHMSTGRRKRGLSPDEVAQNHKRVRTNDSQDEDSSAESDNGLMVESPARHVGQRGGIEDSTGSIAHIELVNFMCHKFLKVPLGRKINFIVGHNGSGKSAILTALAVCLGGRANITNRATTLKDFLREGSQVGSVTVTIRNDGEDAYRPEVYGNAIIIERKIRREGSSNYKIKSAKGALVSTKRDELVAICDHMQIQATNPMTILTQDAARSFLANSTPADKYNFFMTGTGLQHLSADYAMVTENINTIQKVLQYKRQVLPDMKKQVKDLEATLQSLDQAKSLEEAMEEMKKEWAWAQVVEAERRVEQQRNVVSKAEKKVEAVLIKRSDCGVELSELGQEIETLEIQINQQDQAAKPLLEQKKQVTQEIIAIRERLREFTAEEKEMNNTVQTHRRNAEDLRQRIAEEMRKMESDSRITRKQQEALINECEQQKLALEAKLRQFKMERDNVENMYTEASQELQEAQDRCRRWDAEIASCRDRMRELQQQGNDRLRAYGPSMPRVLQAIEDYDRQGRWRGRKPLGPLGLYVKLLREDYASVIETLLGTALNAFVVDNQQDLLSLQEVLDRCQCRSNILRGQGRRLDISNGEPAQEYVTILRALQIDNDIVLEQLILDRHIEQMVLVETRREGDTITANRFPRNVSGVYTKDCFSMGNRGGGLSTQSIHPYRGQPRLAMDVNIFIKQEASRERRAQEDLEAFRPTVQQIHSRLSELGKHRQRLRAEIVALQRESAGKDEEIRQKQEELMDDEEPNVGALREACRHEEDQIELIRRQFQDLQSQRQELQRGEAPLKAQLEQIEHELKIMHERHQALSAKVTDAAERKLRKENEKTHWESRQLVYEEALRQAQDDLLQAQRELERDTEKCEQYCERVPVQRTLEQLEKEIRAAQARLKEMENKHGSREEVETSYLEKKSAYSNAKKEVHNMEVFIHEAKESLRERLKQWGDFRSMISVRARILFRELMSKRGYRGKLLLDHCARLLNLKITKLDDQMALGRRSEGSAAKEKDPRSLSGGEKSFSTVCLLLALWEGMGSPFRALDEFDVFMDAVNRNVSMKAMIDNAREQDRPCQYIFITPQTMGNVPGLNGPDVRVHRLQDPERGQTLLNGHGRGDEEE